MKNFSLIAIFLFVICSAFAINERSVPIEDFDDGIYNISTFGTQGSNPSDWEISSSTTHNGSTGSIRLYGDTWLQLSITPATLDTGAVFTTAFYSSSYGSYQAIGFGDSTNVLYYSLEGTSTLSYDDFLTVYQGAFPSNTWNNVRFPIWDDWIARFEYVPDIDKIVFVNEKSNSYTTNIYFDSIVNITDDLPVVPQVTISDSLVSRFTRDTSERVSYTFTANVLDPDSDTFSYLWSFGDGNYSTDESPTHAYTVMDDHEYVVTLIVTDQTEMSGYATHHVDVDYGETTYPVVLNFAGDVMFTRRMDTRISSEGYAGVFAGVNSILGDAADITVMNLETPLTYSTTMHPTKSVAFKSDPPTVACLTAGGVDIVSLANNHSYDYMDSGLAETQQTLDNAGILYSGAGMNSQEAYRPAFINKSGINFAFLRSCDRTGQYNNAQPYLNSGYDKPGFAMMTPYYVSQQIQEVENFADLKIVEIHCGSEYSTAPGSGYDRFSYEYPGADYIDDNEDEVFLPLSDIPQMWDLDYRHAAIDNGADLVVCHHPHIIQGLEVYNNKLIAHSIGNFAFDLNYPETMATMILYAEADDEGFKDFWIKPVFIDDYFPEEATGELGRHILRYIIGKSRELGTIVQMDDINLEAHPVMDTTHYVLRTEYNSDFYEMQQSGSYYVTKPLPIENGYFRQVHSSSSPGTVYYRLGEEMQWFGNMEDEGCTLWNFNSNYEDYSDAEAYRGQRSLYHSFSNNNTVSTGYEKNYKLWDNQSDYTIHGWMKTSNVNYAKITACWLTGRTSYYPTQEDEVVCNNGNTGNWQYFFGDATPPSNAGYYEVKCKTDFNSNSNSFAAFDDVGLIKWTPWIPVTNTMEFDVPNAYSHVQFRTTDNTSYMGASYITGSYNYEYVAKDDNNVPGYRHELHQNYPNPFNPSTNISFTLKKDSDVELKIYNIKGQMVKELTKQKYIAGKHSVTWTGDDSHNKKVGSGVYFYKLKADGKTVNVRKCVLLK